MASDERIGVQVTQCQRKSWCEKPDQHRGACYPFHEPTPPPVMAKTYDTHWRILVPEGVTAYDINKAVEVMLMQKRWEPVVCKTEQHIATPTKEE